MWKWQYLILSLLLADVIVGFGQPSYFMSQIFINTMAYEVYNGVKVLISSRLCLVDLILCIPVICVLFLQIVSISDFSLVMQFLLVSFGLSSFLKILVTFSTSSASTYLSHFFNKLCLEVWRILRKWPIGMAMGRIDHSYPLSYPFKGI